MALAMTALMGTNVKLSAKANGLDQRSGTSESITLMRRRNSDSFLGHPRQQRPYDAQYQHDSNKQAAAGRRKAHESRTCIGVDRVRPFQPRSPFEPVPPPLCPEQPTALVEVRETYSRMRQGTRNHGHLWHLAGHECY